MNEPIRFLRAEILLGDQKVDVYETPSGEYRLGKSKSSLALGFAANWISQVLTRDGTTLKTLKKMGYKGEVVSGVIDRPRQSGTSSVDTISLKDFEILIDYALSQGKKKAFKLKGINVPLKSKEPNTEKRIQLNLAKQLNAKIEVLTEVGRIDILSDNEIIEIKHIHKWKSALGQVLAYGFYYPEHQKRIHLFGTTKRSQLILIKSHCSNFKVKVTLG